MKLRQQKGHPPGRVHDYVHVVRGGRGPIMLCGIRLCNCHAARSFDGGAGDVTCSTCRKQIDGSKEDKA